MALLTLPKEVEKEEFEEFLERIKQDFPADEYPEIFISYQEIERQGRRLIIVLGLGKSSECARQVSQVLRKHPHLKGQRSITRVLRAPKTKFLLR
jgi:hypothetical protein